MPPGPDIQPRHTEGRRLGHDEVIELHDLLTALHPLRWDEDALDRGREVDVVLAGELQPPRVELLLHQRWHRLVEIEGYDLQPCGGTHVRRTSEIGAVRVTQIEKKGKQNRRVRIGWA